MKNLCITLHLNTPLIPGKYPLNLDGLLYWSAYEGHKEDDAAAQLVLLKALDSKDGIFKSSDMIYLQTPEAVITQSQAVFSTTMNWREFKYPMNKMSVMELGGPYRSRLTTYSSVSVQAVRFYAVGDAKLIRFLIESAGFIGRGNNQGHGEITEIAIEEIDQDLSWYAVDANGDTVLNRCLPAHVIAQNEHLNEQFSSVPTSVVRVSPPYPTSADQVGYTTTAKREVLSFI